MEVNTGFQNLVRRINSSVDAPAIDDPAGIPASTNDELRIHVNDVIRSINDTVVSKTHFTERYNKGFAERKNFLFNQTVLDANAGRFSFRIPLSFIFNFCEDYGKVIFKCKHEISFTRQEDKYAISRDRLQLLEKLIWKKLNRTCRLLHRLVYLKKS